MSQATFSISFDVSGAITQEIEILPEYQEKGLTPEIILQGLNSGKFLTTIGKNPRILNEDFVVVANVVEQSTQAEYYDFVFPDEDSEENE